ncbi:MAG: imidazole glycerol phosphate synthase subunit HisH [Lachnospiraceae bacterium]|nr:imidazole glycerol phosphate synthase subunit HisH [Lachnospiraceae bacterium]
MIAIIDYDAGNIRSVEKAFNFLGHETIVTRDRDILLSADKVILPGVGSFGDAMDKLNNYKLVPVIEEICQKKTPFMGICLGLQLLFKSSEESKGVSGLGILDGDIVRFSDEFGLKIPHIGWNSLEISKDGRLFKDISNQSYVYFVHSYYLKAKDEAIVKATSSYGNLIHASVEKDNIFACQFHPEKSGEVGLKLLSNFANL